MKTPRLAPRPARLLALMIEEDLHLQEAAERLHISLSTANQHAAAARRAMGARTTLAAAVRAMRGGLLPGA